MSRLHERLTGIETRLDGLEKGQSQANANIDLIVRAMRGQSDPNQLRIEGKWGTFVAVIKGQAPWVLNLAVVLLVAYWIKFQ